METDASATDRNRALATAGFPTKGFYYPAHVITTDVRFKRADFVDDTLRQYEVRRGDHILTAGCDQR